METLKKIRCLDGFTLKLLMALLMLMDHLYYFLPGFPHWFHQISRVVAPVFAFLIAEGMAHTSNRKRYIGRLFLFGGIMLAADILFLILFQAIPGNSILMSLAITASMIYCIDRVRSREGSPIAWVVLTVLLLAASVIFEGAFMMPVTGLICYYLRNKPQIMCGVYLVVMALLLQMMSLLWGTQGLMLLAVIPFLLYNGKRGMSNAFSKYFFYVFYPAHIWILFLTEKFLY